MEVLDSERSRALRDNSGCARVDVSMASGQKVAEMTIRHVCEPPSIDINGGFIHALARGITQDRPVDGGRACAIRGGLPRRFAVVNRSRSSEMAITAFSGRQV